MKKVLLNYLVIAALTVAAAFTSCKKDDVNDGKGTGVLTINGKEFPITGATMCVSKHFDEETKYIRSISCVYKDGRSLFFLAMKKPGVSKLETKTYTASEVASLEIDAYIVDGIQSYHGYIDDNVVMEVDVKGITYALTITGLALQYETEAEYTVTYKGKILEETCFY